MSDDIQVGDKVRITIEDVVIKVERSGRTVYLKNEAEDDLWFDLDEGNVASVEVIEKAKPAPVLPDGLTVSEDGSVLNWLGENYVRQPVEHPVVTFKPGDFVRHRSGSTYLVTDKGRVVSLQGGRTIDDPTWYKKYLNSEWYTKVELHEAPL